MIIVDKIKEQTKQELRKQVLADIARYYREVSNRKLEIDTDDFISAKANYLNGIVDIAEQLGFSRNEFFREVRKNVPHTIKLFTVF